MSIYRLSLSTVSRGKGKSVVAAAAYRAAARLVDDRTGLTYDYRGKQRNVVRRALLGWDGTRNSLWDAAERAEAHPRAVTAREIQLALPAELPSAARWRLALEFAGWLRDRYGVAIDVALHRPSRRGDERNHHAHVLLTSRCVERGVLGKKTRVLDVRTTGSRETEAMRATWAAMSNAALAAAGIEEHLDHRSYARQGRDRASEHLGRAAVALEDRGVRTARGDTRRERRRRNGRRAADRAGRGTAPVATAATTRGGRTRMRDREATPPVVIDSSRADGTHRLVTPRARRAQPRRS